MDKTYNNIEWEKIILEKWAKSKKVTPPSGEAARKKGYKPFTIIMPPPNANDPLHVGHAMFVSIEDILIRYHRMLGEASLWLPGTDHAGIETQFVFEKKLAKEDKSRFNFDRETLFRMIWDYVQENSGVAVEQMKKLGASADWSRFKFSLDPEVVSFVLDTFEKMAADNLIYRGERLVNYCTRCGTSYSELEVIYEEKADKLYLIKYPVDGGGEVVVATTRPETMYGDTAVAVNPKDKRYKDLVGKEVILPLTSRKIPIIADEMVDMEFGTGAVKITPAHDNSDYETALRHKLSLIQVFDFNGRMNFLAKEVAGLKIKEARAETVRMLDDLKLLEKVIDYFHNVGVCYRCHNPIEPLPLAQFFIKTKSLAKKVLEALDSKETIILGAGREKILRQWLTNIRDWNISRQIVWGIRLPVWYNIDVNPDIQVSFKYDNQIIHGSIGDLLKMPGHTFLSRVLDGAKTESKLPNVNKRERPFSIDEIQSGLQTIKPPIDAKYIVGKNSPGNNYLQETDTFDTWFSSGQWPIVTLMTAEKGDFEYYYPTSVMETGYDILPIWVMRMMLFGIYLTGKSPFKYVYLHGLVRDESGRKMSKSLGNVINPLTLVDKYGADAVRMALVMSTTAGQDSNTGEAKVRGMRNFANKIWNATRFVVEYENNEGKINSEFSTKLNEVIRQTTSYLDNHKIGLAAEYIYNEFWHWYCDLAIEEAKKGNIGKNQLREALITFLLLLHPFVPFVTEASYRELVGSKKDSQLLMDHQWPKVIAK